MISFFKPCIGVKILALPEYASNTIVRGHFAGWIKRVDRVDHSTVKTAEEQIILFADRLPILRKGNAARFRHLAEHFITLFDDFQTTRIDQVQTVPQINHRA